MINTFKKDWIKAMHDKIRMVYPDVSDEEINEFLNIEYKNSFKDTNCVIYNNYEKEELQTSIHSVIGWLNNKKPILTESGSLFKHHDECWNPNTTILNNKLSERGIVKGEKFEYMERAEETSNPEKKHEYEEIAKQKDLKQGRIKVIVNSEYGASGLVSSWFFNMACATATTAKGQALISTAFNAFEDFLSDSVRFNNMDECMSFISNIIGEKSIRQKKDNRWINNKSIDDVMNRLKLKFANEEDFDINITNRILKNLGQEDLNRIYYKSNMFEFFRNSKRARDLMNEIYVSGKPFMDPKKPCKIIAKPLNKLRDAVLEYVHYNYQFNDRVIRLKTAKRKVVVTIDTDSNFINLGPWLNFVYNEVLTDYITIKRRKEDINGRIIIDAINPTKRYDRKHREENDFRIVMSMVNIMDYMVNNTLMDFLDRTNVPRDNPGNTSMKNEFLYTKILCTPGKKHYQAVIRLQEGKKLDYKMDIKGWQYSPFMLVMVYRIIILTAGTFLKLLKLQRDLQR